MDAVELPLPAAVTVSKLMGSEGCGGAGVAVKDVQSDRVSVNVSPKMDSSGPLPGQNGKTFLSHSCSSLFGLQLREIHTVWNDVLDIVLVKRLF